MSKLNQIIAVVNGKKSAYQAAITEILKTMQKPDLFAGLRRFYQPIDDEGEKLPEENKIVQKKVKDLLNETSERMTEIFDIIAVQEYANCVARADIKVNGIIVAKDVPVTYMLFLEKQLDHAKTIVSKVPVLASDVNWRQSTNDPSVYVADTVVTNRTKKVPKAFIKAPATDKHPAQVEMFTEDVIVGNWNKTDISGAISIKERDEILKRIDTLRDAVKSAREEANMTDVQNIKIGGAITSFIFGT